jgi:hypothetical protein
MPCITFPIDPIGPVLEIGIAPPRSLLAPGSPPPPITWIKAIADTGCTHTSIQTNVAGACGLGVVGKTTITSTTQMAPVNIYLGDVFIRFPMGNTFFEWIFNDRGLLELLHPSPNFSALLGMDILSQGTLHMNGLTKQATYCT